MKDLTNTLKSVDHQVKHLLYELKELEEIKPTLLIDLLTKIWSLDSYYENWCSSADKDYGEEDGTTYNSDYGQSIEFYIEADEWHEISKLIRKIKKVA